ncbi:MAG: hypothetical protein ACRDWY_16075, partial [Actinomycetes bacterium]
AMLWALSADPVPVSAFVAVAPAVQPRQVAGPSHAVPGRVLVGAEDGLVGPTREAVEQLTGATLDVVDGLGHAYPADFDDRLAEALGSLVGPP